MWKQTEKKEKEMHRKCIQADPQAHLHMETHRKPIKQNQKQCYKQNTCNIKKVKWSEEALQDKTNKYTKQWNKCYWVYSALAIIHCWAWSLLFGLYK